MESSDLDDSMVDLIERAEAFLSAHAAVNRSLESRHQEEQQPASSPSNLFEESINDAFVTADESSPVQPTTSADMSSSGDDVSTIVSSANSSDRNADLASSLASANSSNSSNSIAREVELLDSDDSASTVSYEFNLPEAVPYVQVLPVIADREVDDDSVILVSPAHVPTIDLCSPAVFCDNLEGLSPQSRRRRRRRLAANAPIIDSINLDDTVVDHHAQGIAGCGAAASASIRDPAPQVTANPTELHVKRAKGAVSTDQDTSLNSKFTCPICLDSIFQRKAASTICGHLFCYICITHEFTLRKQCPICKRKLARGQIHPIYLN